MIGFAGSRSLPSVGRQGGLVSRVVGSVAGAGRSIGIGCCVGADAAILRARLALALHPSTSHISVNVFAAFGPGGEGSCSLSAVSPVCQLAAPLARSPGHGCYRPVTVNWWAGGQANVPLHRRLAARSSALVQAVAASSNPAMVIFFGKGQSHGSVRTAALSHRAGLPVYAFLAAGAQLPVMGAGRWQPVRGRGIWSRAWLLA